MTATTENTNPLGSGQKLVLAALLAALLAMFVGSFLYRMQGTGLVVEIKQEHGGMGKGGPMGGMGGIDMDHLRDLMRLMEQNPNDPKVLLELGNTFMMMQAWDKALEFLGQAEKITPDDPQVHRAVGMVRFERKEFDLARKAFDKVLKKAPDDAVAHYNMGVLLKHYMKKPAEGDVHFRKVVELAPKDQEVLHAAQEELAAPAAK